MKRTLITIATAALATLGTATLAHAQHDQAAEACKDDAAKLCPGVKPGEGRIMECLKEHKSEVSSECKKAVAKHRRAKRRGGKEEADSGSDQ
ncbi:MAG: cysteine rich repeat-containing protein [Burkholderiales bacterium]|nr:cysteine rich repeat-containing protein [Burkholderiales bacterium]